MLLGPTITVSAVVSRQESRRGRYEWLRHADYDARAARSVNIRLTA